MAADRQAAVRISADGQQVITTYDRVGDAATQASARIKAASDAANSSAGRFAQGLSNAFGRAKDNVANLSFQVQDAAVQLASGQNPLTVLIQQGTQVASVFGPAGAVVGAVGAGLGLIAGFLFDTGEESDKAAEKAYQFKDALSFLGETATTTAAEIAKLTGAYRQASAASQELARFNLQKQERDLEAELADLRQRAGTTLQGLRQREEQRPSFIREQLGLAPRDITPPAALDAIQRFAEGGSLEEAVRQVDALAKTAEETGNDQLRQLADSLLDIANAGAVADAKLQGTRDQLQALIQTGGEATQAFPVSVGPFAPPKAPAGAAAPATRPRTRTAAVPVPDSRAAAAVVAADSAAVLQAQRDADQARLDQQIAADDLRYRQLVADADRRRDFTLQTLSEEEGRLKQDPAAYYRQTGDQELASIYDPLTGATEAFRKLSDESQQYGRIIGESIAGGAQVASQAISAFVLEGKSGIKDLAKTVADQLLTGALSIFINGIVGGAGTSLTNYFSGTTTPGSTGASPLTYGGPRAGGGRVGSDRWYWVGENGPERFVPDRAGRIEPMAGGGGGGTVVNVIDKRGADAPPIEQQRSRGANGEEVLTLMVRSEVKRQLAGGGFDREMRGRYGARPRPQR